MRIPAPLSAWTVLALSGASLLLSLQVDASAAGPSSVKISGPKPAIQGEGNDYICSAECTPPCTYSWFVDGDDLNMHRTKLTVIAGQRKPFTLECTALNPESGESFKTTETIQVTCSLPGDKSGSMALKPRTALCLVFSVGLLVHWAL
ncbi:hypothetical protein AGOR_G00212110 [Albula goreensis]|uniref:Ig-like domain-containing protein n=1 Tax=Albula goreensis TaxID=1534307 RepID=A0A8T3CUG0_9TELE|nr:hypothetical protein AGOR_G00212110 [Albula goreensis]